MSERLDEQARHMLRETKLYCTEARVAILRVLLEANGPLRQDQIAGWESHKLNKVTVYRTLDSLAEAGLVHRAFLQNRAWHFELADHCSEKQCHPHFTCTNCGVTRCMTDISLPLAKIPQKGYVISRQQVRLEGLCPACA
ncbi:MAG: transcriptional repressor [Planctomycetes bacterium]|jgi:Fur family ferric uptake transcriptional regulator|nr:transcriptional repressor [Planctomycetota bacterium]